MRLAEHAHAGHNFRAVSTNSLINFSCINTGIKRDIGQADLEGRRHDHGLLSDTDVLGRQKISYNIFIDRIDKLATNLIKYRNRFNLLFHYIYY
jgi:hypothetical protein